DFEQVGHDPALSFDPVILDLDEEIVPSDNVLKLGCRGEGGIEVSHSTLAAFFGGGVGCEQLRYQTTETSGCDDDPLGMFGEQVEVDPWLVVVALGKGLRRNLEKVAVSRLALGEQDVVIPLVLGLWRAIEA